MSSCSSSECRFEGFEPRPSLWKLVEEFLPLEEQSEVKKVLGEDIIDEIADLHGEVSVLLEIWQDYRDENEKKTKEISLKSHYERLPEPPEMRGNLKKEIQLFVTALRQRSVENGSIEPLVLSLREKNIVDYAFTKKDLRCLRPRTALSSESGRSTPCRPSSSSGSRSSSSLRDVMQSFQEQLNVQDVDQLADRLRNILYEEKNVLLEDITFLQNLLFEESYFMKNLQDNGKEEPSIQELKELGMKLEKEMTTKGTPSPLVRTSCSSPPRRPARSRHIVRSSSSPSTSNPTRDKKPPVILPLRSKPESTSASEASLKKSISESYSSSPPRSRDVGLDSSSPPTSAVIRKTGTESMSPSTSALSKRSGSESLSPSPPTSAVLRKSGSVCRFRRIVLDSRHGEC